MRAPGAKEGEPHAWRCATTRRPCARLPSCSSSWRPPARAADRRAPERPTWGRTQSPDRRQAPDWDSSSGTGSSSGTASSSGTSSSGSGFRWSLRFGLELGILDRPPASKAGPSMQAAVAARAIPICPPSRRFPRGVHDAASSFRSSPAPPQRDDPRHGAHPGGADRLRLGQAVRLTTNGASNGFITGPITVPSGVTLGSTPA